MSAVAALLLAPLVLTAAQDPAGDPQGPGVQAINGAIDRGVGFLLQMQQADGSWTCGQSFYDYPEGGTALAVAALLHSGVDPDHQAVQRGLAFVRSRPQLRFYGTTTRILMEDILGPHQDMKSIKACAEFIASGASKEYFDYPMAPPKPDLSNTQYCILSLWLAVQNGIKVPERIFEDMIRVILREQNKDGGWAYFMAPQAAQPGAIPIGGQERFSTCSMTTAGMSSLLFCLDALGQARQKKYAEDVEEALHRAYAWLDQHMSYEGNGTLEPDDTNAKQWDLYYFYTIERLGFISARDVLGGKPWYPTGAAHLVKSQYQGGGWSSRAGGNGDPSNTAFALLFLVRATESRTGEGSRGKAKVIASADPESEEVDLRILPGAKTVAWIAGFGQEAREAYGKKGVFGLRVEQVRYFVDGEQVALVEGDVNQVSGNARFEVELAVEPGDHQVEAVVTIAPEPERGATVSDKRVNLDSARLRLRADWVLSEEQRRTMRELEANLVLGSNPEISVSSEREGAFNTGAMVADGTMANGWRPQEGDAQPWIRLSWRKGLKAEALVLTPLQSNPPMDWFQRPSRIELKVNGKTRELDLAGTVREHVDLGKAGAVKTLEIKILASAPPADGSLRGTGFAEVELIGKVRKEH